MRYVVGSWVTKKLNFLKFYLPIYTATISKGPSRLYYIDAFASSGKNRLRGVDQILEGSPLIALNTRPPFTSYIFIESSGWYFNELLENIASHQKHFSIQSFFDDSNKLLPDLLRKIPNGSRLFVFFDPEGIQELLWDTVEEVGKRGSAELLITFSCMAVARCCQKRQDEDVLDRFFGTKRWRNIARKRKLGRLTPERARKAFVDLYKIQLRKHFKYVDDVVLVKTEHHKPLYYLILATQDRSLVKIGRQYKTRMCGVE